MVIFVSGGAQNVPDPRRRHEEHPKDSWAKAYFQRSMAQDNLDLVFLESLINSKQMTLRPRSFVYNPSNLTETSTIQIPTVVRGRLLLETVSKISEIDMAMTSTFTFHILWSDDRFESNQTTDLLVPSGYLSSIWRPDIAVQGLIGNVMVQNEAMAVSPNGDVNLWTKMTATTSCKMDLRFFPMDTQNCRITFYSFRYSNDEVVLVWNQLKNQLYAASSATLNSFRLMHHNQSVMSTEFSGCPKNQTWTPGFDHENGPASCLSKYYLVHEFEFRRYFFSVFVMCYVPALTMVLIGGLGTFVDPKSSPARVMLGVTSILTIITIIQSTKAQFPMVNYLTALDIYLWTCFLFVGSVLAEFICMSYTTIVLGQESGLREKEFYESSPRKLFRFSTTSHVVDTNVCDLDSVFGADLDRRTALFPTCDKAFEARFIEKKEGDSTWFKKMKQISQTLFLSDNYTHSKSLIFDACFRTWYLLAFLAFNAGYWAYFTLAIQHSDIGKESVI